MGRLPSIGTALCNDIGKLLGISVGDPRNIDWRTMADGYSFDPGGSSFHLLMHWAQRIRSDSLRKFDWGVNNSKHYNGSNSPPLYDLSRITGAKLALFDGDSDLFITKEDIKSLLSEVPQKIGSSTRRSTTTPTWTSFGATMHIVASIRTSSSCSASHLRTHRQPHM